MEKQEIIDMMQDRGFTFNMECRDGKGNTISLCFMSEPTHYKRMKEWLQGLVRIPSFSCTIYPKSGEFEFTYMVSGSINTLSTPKCSPFTNEEHFDRICVKFESMVQVLYHTFGDGQV